MNFSERIGFQLLPGETLLLQLQPVNVLQNTLPLIEWIEKQYPVTRICANTMLVGIELVDRTKANQFIESLFAYAQKKYPGLKFLFCATRELYSSEFISSGISSYPSFTS